MNPAIETDVLVVGGGVIGCALAYWLAGEGLDVALIDRHDLNTQASGCNAGSLHVQIMSFQLKLTDERSRRRVDTTLRMYAAGVGVWQELANTLDTDIELHVDGGLMIAETEAQLRVLEDKVKRERASGLDNRIVDRAGLGALAPYLSEHLVGAEVCPLEGRVNPAIATPSLARGAEARGARLFRHAELRAIERDGRGFKAETSRGPIRCGRIVNAAGRLGPEIAAMVGIRLPPVEGEVLHMNVTEPVEHFVDHLVQHAERRLTFKQATTGGLLIGGGWPAVIDKRTGLPISRRTSIQGNLWIAQATVPRLAHLRIVRTWAAINALSDAGPLLGEVPGVPGFHNALFADAGYTAGPIVARLVTEALMGRKPTFEIRGLGIE